MSGINSIIQNNTPPPGATGLGSGSVPLILGEFTFDEQFLEVPETFGDLAGTQSTQQHDFPGGVRTQQTFGYFPSPLQWRARFHGQFATDDVEAVKRILIAGREVTLSYGERAWKGRLVKFSPTVRSQWLYDYSLEFWPREDVSSGFPQPPTLAGYGAILALHILALESIINGDAGDAVFFEAIAAVAAGPITQLINTTQAALLTAGGIVNSITTSNQQDIAAQSLASLNTLAPLQASPDPSISFPAWSAASRVRAINTIITAPQPPIATIHTVNPNLVVLSTQYYQDPQHWRAIASANGLSDPQPIGTFDLIIPPNP